MYRKSITKILAVTLASILFLQSGFDIKKVIFADETNIETQSEEVASESTQENTSDTSEEVAEQSVEDSKSNQQESSSSTSDSGYTPEETAEEKQLSTETDSETKTAQALETATALSTETALSTQITTEVVSEETTEVTNASQAGTETSSALATQEVLTSESVEVLESATPIIAPRIMPYLSSTSANWVEGSGTADLVNVGFSATNTAEYYVNTYSGVETTLVVTVPFGMSVSNYTKAKDSDIIKTVDFTTDAAGVQTISYVFKKEQDYTAMLVAYKIDSHKVYSQQKFNLNAVYSIDGTAQTEYKNSIKCYDFRGGNPLGSATFFGSTTPLIYQNTRTRLNFGITAGTIYDNPITNNILNVAISTIDLDLSKIIVNGRAINAGELAGISVETNSMSSRVGNILRLTNMNLNVNNAINMSAYVTFPFPPGTTISFPNFQNISMYENYLVNEPNALVHYPSATLAFGPHTVPAPSASFNNWLVGGSSSTTPNDSIDADPNVTQGLAKVAFSAEGLSMSNASLNVLVPPTAVVTHIQANNAGSYIPFTISRADGSSPTVVTSSGTTALSHHYNNENMKITIHNMIAGSVIDMNDIADGNGIQLIGRSNGTSGQSATFSTNTFAYSGGAATSWPQTVTRTLANPSVRYADMTASSFLNENKVTKDSFVPGEDMYLASGRVYHNNIILKGSVKTVEDLIFYFSVPAGFFSRNKDYEITRDDIEIEGTNTWLTQNDLDVSVLKSGGVKYAGYNAGGFIVKVKVNNSKVSYKDWKTGVNSNESLRLLLKLKVDPTKITTTPIALHKATVALGTFSPKARNIEINSNPGNDTMGTLKDFGASKGNIVTWLDGTVGQSVTIEVPPTATMFVAVNKDIVNSTDWEMFGKDNTVTLPTKAGIKGAFKVTLANNTSNNLTASKGYFVIPNITTMGAVFSENIIVTPGSVAGGVIEYTDTVITDEIKELWSKGEPDGVTWNVVSGKPPVSAKAIRLSANAMNKLTFFEVTLPYQMQKVDYKTVSYGDDIFGGTAYNFTNPKVGAINVENPNGVTGGFNISKSNIPVITPSASLLALDESTGFNIEYWTGWTEAAQVRASYNVFTSITDDINSVAYGNANIALDNDASTVNFIPAGASMLTLSTRLFTQNGISFANFNPATDISTRRIGKYVFNYVTEEDFDSQTNLSDPTLFRKIVVPVSIKNPVNVVKPDTTNIKLVADKESIQNEAQQYINWDAFVKIPSAVELANYYKYQVDFKMPADSNLDYLSAKLFLGNTEITNFGNATKNGSVISYNFTDIENMLIYADTVLTIRYATKYNGNGKATSSTLLGYASAFANNNQNVGFNPSEATVKVEKGYSNIDEEKPVINVSGISFEWPVNVPISKQNIIDKAEINITDNKDRSDDLLRDLSIEVIGSVNYRVLGEYGLTLNVTDSSGNKADQKTITVIVVDKVKPLITVKSPIIYEIDSNISIEQFIKENIFVTDNYWDKNAITIPNYGNINYGKLGTYFVTVVAIDGSGNKATKENVEVLIVRKPVPSPSPAAPVVESAKPVESPTIVSPIVTEPVKPAPKPAPSEDPWIIRKGPIEESYGYGEFDDDFGDLSGVGVIVRPTYKYFDIDGNDLPWNIRVSKDGNYFVMIDRAGNELGYAILEKGGNPRSPYDWLLLIDSDPSALKKNPSTKDLARGWESTIAMTAMVISLIGGTLVFVKKKEEEKN